MEYGYYEITLIADDAGFKGHVRRFDGRHFTLAGSTHPHMLMAHANTAISYQTEEEAVENARLIADAARP